MKIYRLRSPLTVDGFTLSGLTKTKITFHPDTFSNDQGKKDVHFAPLQIAPDNSLLLPCPLSLLNTSLKRRRIKAIDPNERWSIQAVEHLATLRFLFPGMFISGNGEMSHFSYAGEILDKLLSCSDEVDVNIPFWRPANTYLWEYPKHRGGYKAYTFVESNPNDTLEIKVTVSFPAFGEKTKTFIFPDFDLYLQVCRSKPIGRPEWLKPMADLLWRHSKTVFWPDASTMSDSDILDTLLLHRAHDILGAIALYPQQAFPAMKITSQCSGHMADWYVLLQMLFKEDIRCL